MVIRHHGSSSNESHASHHHHHQHQQHGKGGGGGGGTQDAENIRTKPPHIYDNLTRKLLQLGVTLALTTFVGLIVRYAVQEFDPSVNTITVTTSRVNNRDVASLSVSKNFLERILEFVEQSIAIIAAIIPLGFPLLSLCNRHFARVRAGAGRRFEIRGNSMFQMLIPKYLVVGDSQALQVQAADVDSGQPQSQQPCKLRPLVRDTIYHLIRARMKPKLILEENHEEARQLGIRIGLIGRHHHRLAVVRSVDLLKQITDSRGDIKQAKVRYLLARMKIMSQSTPADKSLLIYLMKYCEPLPNQRLVYLGHSFTDPEAMRLADCSLTYDDCDDDDVKREAQILVRSTAAALGGGGGDQQHQQQQQPAPFTDIYLLLVVFLLSSNIVQSYALYQLSASVSACIYRFLSITVFQEQLLSHSQFNLLATLQQVLAICALMTKWLSSLPRAPLPRGPASLPAAVLAEPAPHHHHHHHQHLENGIQLQHMAAGQRRHDDTLGSSSSLEEEEDEAEAEADVGSESGTSSADATGGTSSPRRRRRRRTRASRSMSRSRSGSKSGSGSALARAARSRSRPRSRSRSRGHRSAERPVRLTGADLDQSVMDSRLAASYKQTFRNSGLVDDVTYRLAKLHVAYQVLVMIIIMIFGNAMFQLNADNQRQHQTLAFNSLMMNNIFSLASCFNQMGEFNLRSGLRNHPFFVCVLLFALALQVCLTELNAFGLENLNPLQWFVCLVFALMSALIAPLTGQQRASRELEARQGDRLAEAKLRHRHHHQHHQQQQQQQHSRSPHKSGQQQQYSHGQGQGHHGHKPRTSSSKSSSPSKVRPAAGGAGISSRSQHLADNNNNDDDDDAGGDY